LRDRLGVALTFLSDGQLKETLGLFKEQAIANMDLEYLYIVGLGKEGQDLIHTYMERTGDIQSAVLFAFSCAPFHEVLFSQYPKWAHVYNTLLDRWMLWSIHIRGITEHVTGQEISLECRTCWKTVKQRGKSGLEDHPLGFGAAARKPSSMSLSSASTSAPPHEQHQTGRMDVCRHCKNPYPLCSVCQMPLGSPVVEKHVGSESPLPGDEMSHWFTWCQRCKHGGHVGHLRDWFRMSDVCPVKGCECCCQALDHVIE
jgi:WD repeat-containing protein mio